MPPHESWFVTRTMRALEVLAFEPMSAPQLADALAVHPRTARRLLTRLLEEDYVSRTDDARRIYAPTMRIAALAGQVVEHAELTRRAVPFVEALHRSAGGAAHLMVPSYREVLCLVHANESGPTRPRLGELVPSHCTAPGKALLGHRRRWRESLLSAPLEPHTPRTITDSAAFLREAETIRERGYAVEDGEYRDGERGVAAPVFLASRDAVAAISVHMRTGQEVEDLVPLVLARARELTAELEGDHG